jgi:hypothetical protein
MDAPCGVCGQTVAVIKNAGAHVVSLHCESCDRHRGWLSEAIAVSLISRFGLLPEPNTIRNQEFRASECDRAYGCTRGRNVRTLAPKMKGYCNVKRYGL